MNRVRRLSNNPFGEVWRTRRSATSIVATAAGRVRRSFRLTPSGRFATFGGKCPGCSIIRASLTVALMVSLPSQISAFCALAARSPCICSRLRVALRYAQQPTGLTLPSGAPSGRFATFGGKCPGCSIIRASLTVALMVSLPRFGSLWAFGPSAHRAHASLRATGHTLPSAHLRVALPPLAATAHRAGASLRCRAGGEFAPLGANIS